MGHTERRAFGKPKRKWEGNLEIGLNGTGLETMNCIYWAEYKDHWKTVFHRVMNISVP
jgi:hypothetical protein